MAEEFAGKTPTGSKVHRAWSSHETACWQYISNRPMYMTKTGGKVSRKNLCQKCFGNNPSPEYLKSLGLELVD